MRASIVATALLALAACGGPALDGSAEDDVTAPRHFFTLANAPVVAAHPTALVYPGRGFKPDGKLNLVVHFHGWQNCVANDAEAKPSPCTKGGGARTAHNYLAQLDASGANAVFVGIELHFDQATSDDGRLAQAGFFRAMLDELLPHIGEVVGRSYDEDDLGALVLSSHSGGYQALAHTLAFGGLTERVRQVILLDSVYGFVPTFEAWARASLGQNRLAVVYTDGGGTLANAQKLATDLKASVGAAGLGAALVLDDRTYATQPQSAFSAPLVFKHSALAHDQTAMYYFGKLVQAAALQ